jgi:RNA polymerase sigma-70 factor (sigma-E family)
VEAEESFRAYVRGRTAALSRIAYLLTGDRHLAEDLVQETLLRVAGRWRRIVAGGDPDAYVRRTLYNQHVSIWRRGRLRPLPVVEPPDTSLPDPAGGIVERVSLHAALAQLAPRQRAVVVLRYFEDLSETQTAEVLGCRVGTPKKR